MPNSFTSARISVVGPFTRCLATRQKARVQSAQSAPRNILPLFSLFPFFFSFPSSKRQHLRRGIGVRRKRSRPSPTFCKLTIPLVGRPIVSNRDSIRDLQRGTACRNAYNLVGRSGSRSLDSRLRDVPRNKSDALS